MIKKSLALIMAALIAVAFTACNSTSETEGSSESTESVSSSESEKTSSEASEESASETSADSSEETSETSTYTIEDLTVPDGSGTLLKTALQEFMDSMNKDVYLLKYSVEYYTSGTDGETVKGTNTIKRSGEKISSLMEADGYDSNLQIVKDGKVYKIDDDEKTVSWAEVSDYLVDNFTVYTASVFYISPLELCGSGKETIDGVEYDYEEYKDPDESSEDSSESSAEESDSSETSEDDEPERARYYFDENGKLAGLKHIKGDYYYTTMILELSEDVSDSDFEYPEEYTLVESSASETSGVESSTAESSASESSSETSD